MVKIFRKVAVEFSREVEIIGGGGQIVSGGGGRGLNIFGSKWNYFRGAEFFHGNCNFSWGTFFCAGSVLLRFTKIPGVFQVFSRLILNFPGVKNIPILSIADRISYKYVCYLS